ncbi:MAG TPA: adenosylcobinamide-phosphate synthase CbiB [Acidimicrobiales bacterium]|nr:adenosylcobinamide-phosphate synthase CbiB [Acidimicrobiales bacterium]
MVIRCVPHPGDTYCPIGATSVTSWLAGTAAAAAAGIVADRILGEPPVRPHPVAAFGSVMRAVERRLYRDTRRAGVAHAGIGIGLGALGGWALGSTGASTALAVAGRSLATAAGEVGAALDAGDLDRARALLPALAGRDPQDLDEKEVARAVVESVAENTVDAVVAPALWGAFAGAPGALGYRAVNTLDAMVGHHSTAYERYGWASARLDDVAGWVPARVTAGLVAAVRPKDATVVWRAVRRDAPAHPSPNAGVAEAAFAAALGLRLGGANSYAGRIDLRPAFGDGRPPDARDIGRAVALANDVGLALAAALGALALVARNRGRAAGRRR